MASPEQWECAVNTPIGMPDDWCHFEDRHEGRHSWESPMRAPLMTAFFYLKGCRHCGAYHRSAKYTRFCPACGKDRTEIIEGQFDGA